MKVISWRLCRLIKVSVAAVVLILLIYVINFVVYILREHRCSEEESVKLIKKLCEDYNNNKVDGKLCDAICHTKQINYQKCTNYRLGKKVFIAECKDTCEEGRTVKSVIKTKAHELHHSEPIELDTYKNKSYTSDSWKMIQTIMGDHIRTNTHRTFENLKEIFSTLWMMDLDSFLKNAKYPGADVVAVQSLWSLINQDEYLFMSVYQDAYFVPKVYGTCGAFYVMEFTPPGEVLKSTYFNAKKKIWKDQVHIALQMLDISSSFDIDFAERLHFCDVKEENFGLTSANQVKILDTDSLFFDTSMMRDLGQPRCDTHEDCDFFDCRGWCDVDKNKCVPKRTNNNLQNICEDIFIPRAINFYTGLLYNPPDSIATELRQVLEECAYPNQNKGEIVRSPTSNEIYWKLVNLLRKSKRSIHS